MACVETSILVPDSRKKVDELFLFWLSEPSTQEMLRKELAKLRGVSQNELNIDYLDLSIPTSSFTSTLRPSSPNLRAPSPPPGLSRSPKSPRGRSRSPKKGHRSPKNQEHGLSKSVRAQDMQKVYEENVDEVDFAIQSNGSENESNLISKPAAIDVKRRGRSRSPKPADLPKAPAHHQVIPQFYFPHGKPNAEENVEECLQKAEKIFAEQLNGELGQSHFEDVSKVLGVPLYWKAPLFVASLGKAKDRTTVTFPMLQKMWRRVTSHCHDDASRFVKLLATNGQSYLTEDDFVPLIQDLVNAHPGLAFLNSAPEFHERYVETVIGRIFYEVDKNWNGRITASELRRSNFLQTLASLEKENDINRVIDYFSYEHFYVIYCKFWELDTDHDLEINAQDLARHADHALPSRIINRVLSGVVTRNRKGSQQENQSAEAKMEYKDFVWFLLAEENKTSPRSIEYWFRVLDIDGDGVLSLFELVYFYEEILQRLQELNIDCLSVENTVCQILDMINPKEIGKITLRDLKSSKMTPVFFNTFVNVEKYLEFEQRDPVAAARETDSGEATGESEWDRYAAEQYELLIQEDSYDQEDFEETNEDTNSSVDEEEQEILNLLR
ncbi:serine/threonine-protein phosphatase 2A regulatory subunit B'' subunit delta-like isoform X2 [Halichondria panicea]|uniref:serine/threonine-protein phosphatase 2A regulatory subunit B'' subunit delta-like isoform X2 n=1 Tax=Halichondria panicea TaxID=6063 RepID=UPI00312B5784